MNIYLYINKRVVEQQKAQKIRKMNGEKEKKSCITQSYK